MCVFWRTTEYAYVTQQPPIAVNRYITFTTLHEPPGYDRLSHAQSSPAGVSECLHAHGKANVVLHDNDMVMRAEHYPMCYSSTAVRVNFLRCPSSLRTYIVTPYARLRQHKHHQIKADAVGAEALAKQGLEPLPFSPYRIATRALMYGTALSVGCFSAGVLVVGYSMGVTNVRTMYISGWPWMFVTRILKLVWVHSWPLWPRKVSPSGETVHAMRM